MSNLQILFQAPIFSVQLLIDGLLVGAIFALVAYGMALVWGVMNIINVAQGELVMLGGYVTLIAVPRRLLAVPRHSGRGDRHVPGGLGHCTARSSGGWSTATCSSRCSPPSASAS